MSRRLLAGGCDGPFISDSLNRLPPFPGRPGKRRPQSGRGGWGYRRQPQATLRLTSPTRSDAPRPALHSLTGSPAAGGKLVAARPGGGRLLSGRLQSHEGSRADLGRQAPERTQLQAALRPAKPAAPIPAPSSAPPPGLRVRGRGWEPGHSAGTASLQPGPGRAPRPDAGPAGTMRGGRCGQACADACHVPGSPFPPPRTRTPGLRG